MSERAVWVCVSLCALAKEKERDWDYHAIVNRKWFERVCLSENYHLGIIITPNLFSFISTKCFHFVSRNQDAAATIFASLFYWFIKITDSFGLLYNTYINYFAFVWALMVDSQILEYIYVLSSHSHSFSSE